MPDWCVSWAQHLLWLHDQTLPVYKSLIKKRSPSTFQREVRRGANAAPSVSYWLYGVDHDDILGTEADVLQATSLGGGTSDTLSHKPTGFDLKAQWRYMYL